MSILMPPMHSLSQFDPFNSQSYSTPLFDPQEHYLPPAAFSPASYAPAAHPFPMDPRWYNTSFSGHASAAPHFSSVTCSDIISPHTQTDLLSLSPSSTITPIPPLSGTRNRQGSMSSRLHPFANPSRRLQRQSTTGSATNTTQPRIARRSTISSSPSLPLQSTLDSPTTTGIPLGYMHSPPLQSPQDGHETRAAKRRRTNDHDTAAVQHQSFSAVPEPPQLLTQVQPPHLAQIHGHGYPPNQTWAGPPSADPLPPHVVSADQHGYSPWSVASYQYYPTDQHFADHTLPASDVSRAQSQALPYPSPTVAGPAFFASPASPVLDTPVSAHFLPTRKVEPDSPRIEEDVVDEAVNHAPTEFPPRPYEDGKSPWTPVKPVGKIYGSRLEQMPAIEARLARLEDSLDHYLDVRAAQALKNSVLPGLEYDQPSVETKPMAPCRMFGGRIWPTALARRVRRTPRD